MSDQKPVRVKWRDDGWHVVGADLAAFVARRADPEGVRAVVRNELRALAAFAETWQGGAGGTIDDGYDLSKLIGQFLAGKNATNSPAGTAREPLPQCLRAPPPGGWGEALAAIAGLEDRAPREPAQWPQTSSTPEAWQPCPAEVKREPAQEDDRDQLGRVVREAWVRWAKTQPNPKPSWLLPYDDLAEPDKEADRQIGEAVARAVMPSPPGVPMGYREAAQDVGAPAGPGALVRRLELVAHFLTGLTYTSNAAAVQEAVAALAALQKRVRELEADRRSLTDALQDKLNAGFAEGVAAGRADLKRLLDAAFGLYDNRRGHHPDNPSWNAPAEWWRTLGEALEPFRALTPSPAPDALLPGLRHVLLHRVLPIDDNNWVQAEILRLSSPPAFLATGR